MQWGFGPFRRCRRRRPIRLDEIGVSLRIATTGADPPDTVGDLDSLDGVLGERLGWVLCHGDRLRCRRLIGSLNSAPGSRCVAGRSGAERQSAQGHAVEGEPETAHQDEGGQHVDGMALPIISVRRRLPRNRYATSTASTAPPSALLAARRMSRACLTSSPSAKERSVELRPLTAVRLHRDCPFGDGEPLFQKPRDPRSSFFVILRTV